MAGGPDPRTVKASHDVNDLIQSITGADAFSYTANVLLLTMVSSVLIAVGQVFLARRNDLGWWFVMLGLFAGPLFIALYPGMNDYWLLLGALPQFVAAAIGLYGFSRHPLKGRFTRRVPLASFSVVAVLGLLLFTAVVGLLQFGQALTKPQVLFGPGTLTPWINFLCTAAISAAFIGIGFGARWAWWFSALGGLGLAGLTTAQPALSGADRPLFVLLLSYVLVLVTALFGYFTWLRPVAAADADAPGDAVDEADAKATSVPDDAVSDDAERDGAERDPERPTTVPDDAEPESIAQRGAGAGRDAATRTEDPAGS